MLIQKKFFLAYLKLTVRWITCVFSLPTWAAITGGIHFQSKPAPPERKMASGRLSFVSDPQLETQSQRAPYWCRAEDRWEEHLRLQPGVCVCVGGVPMATPFWVSRTVHMLTVSAACLTGTTGAWEYVGNQVPMTLVAPLTPIRRDKSKHDHRSWAWRYQPMAGTLPSFVLA